MQMTLDVANGIRQYLLGKGREFLLRLDWQDTPQGFDHWNRIYLGAKTPDDSDRDYLIKLLKANNYTFIDGTRKFGFRNFWLTDSNQLESCEHAVDMVVSEYVGSEALTSRNTPRHMFSIENHWKSCVHFQGLYLQDLRHNSLVTLVEYFEDGSFKVFGDVDPTLTPFGLKTPEDSILARLKRTSERCNFVTYDWDASGMVEDLVYMKSGYDHSSAIDAAHYYRPVFSEDHVEVFMNARDVERGRRTKIRFGRFLRILLPGAEESQLESIQNIYRERYIKREFNLNRGSSRKDFRDAYLDDTVKNLNPRTCSSRKSLHNSCMQHEEIQGFSPAETYASGDFEILYLTDDNGRVAGRVVVYTGGNGKPQAGPVYGSCEHSINLLEEELDKMEAVRYEDASWKGAKLKKIAVYSDSYLVCYCDLESSAGDYDDEYFTIGGDGVELHATSGFIDSVETTYCSCCDGRVHVEDVCHNNYGEPYCEACYSDRYQTCAVTNIEFEAEDGLDVLTSNKAYYYLASVQNPGWIFINAQDVSYDECPHEGEYWLSDDMVLDADEVPVSPRYAQNNMVLVGDLYYSEEQLKENGLDAEGNKIEDDAEEEEKEEAA